MTNRYALVAEYTKASCPCKISLASVIDEKQKSPKYVMYACVEKTTFSIGIYCIQ